MKPTSRVVAIAQIWLSALWFALVFALLVIMYGMGESNRLTPDAMKSFDQWPHWLRDGGLVVLYFWFQRLREGGVDGANTVTQTFAGPDGAVRTVTSPAHLPLPTVGPAAGAPPSNPTQPAQPASGEHQ